MFFFNIWGSSLIGMEGGVFLKPCAFSTCVELMTREGWQDGGGRWLLATSRGVMVAVIFRG